MKQWIICGLATASLIGCTTPSRPVVAPIPASDVINSVKCGLALALFEEQSTPEAKRLTGNVASLELQLKVTTGQTAGGSVAGVIPFQGGPTILPTLSATRATAWTSDSTIKASYKLDATNTQVCGAAGITVLSDTEGDPLGFARWLALTLEDLGKVALEGPSGVLNSLTFEAAFGVNDQKGGAATLQLAFLTANLNAADTRNDLQRIKVVISGAPAPAAPSPSGASTPSTSGASTGGNNLGPLRSDEMLQNFSTVAPSY